MSVRLLFRIIWILQPILLVNASFERFSIEKPYHENGSQSMNVLAAVSPPFTYFNSSHGFIDGIDILILKTIASQLKLKLVLTKADDIDQISADDLR